VAHQHDRRLTAPLDNDFGEPFQRDQGLRVQVVRIVDEQGDGLLGAPEQFLKVAFTPGTAATREKQWCAGDGRHGARAAHRSAYW
jgi:hypothetical protein